MDPKSPGGGLEGIISSSPFCFLGLDRAPAKQTFMKGFDRACGWNGMPPPRYSVPPCVRSGPFLFLRETW